MIAPQFRPLVGGYERAAERLAGELAKEGHRVTVVTERREASWPRRELGLGFELRRLRCLYRPGIHAMTSLLSFTAFLLIHGGKYHIIHVHQYGYHAALALVVGKLFQIPVVVKLTNTGAQGIKDTLAAEQKWPHWLAFLHKRMDACIVTTEEVQKEAVQFGIAQDRIRLIPNGINTQYFKPCTSQEKVELKCRLGLKRSCVVLYAGRLTSAKNPEGLIEAWRSIDRDMPNAELVLIGDGPLRTVLEDRVTALGLNGSVRLAGLQSDVLAWYQAADVFILPSHREGLSNSLLEAMSCGLPIVSTRVSGSTGVFAERDVGELVDVGDTPGLVRALRSLLSDGARRRLCSCHAREHAARTFSIETITEKTLALYMQLVHGGLHHS